MRAGGKSVFTREVSYAFSEFVPQHPLSRHLGASVITLSPVAPGSFL
jgi:hypothetical protein